MTMRRKRLGELLAVLGSVPMTLFCLGLMMILVVFGTLAQVEMGTFNAQREFFSSWFLYGSVGGWRIPAFPGGLLVGSLWLVNLVVAFFNRFQFRRRDAGVLLSHLGLILLLGGQGLTQLLAKEGQMPIEVGQSRNFSESFRDAELALIDVSHPDYDEVTAIPVSRLARRRPIRLPKLGVTLQLRQLYRNAELRMDGGSGSLATQGIGTRFTVEEQPPVSTDDEVNNVTALVEILGARQSPGTWWVAMSLGAPQSFSTPDGREVRLALRPQRTYYPYTLTLKQFRHDRYPGTDIPKNFSSLVRIDHPAQQESRDALIYMNHPLRYQGSTFYQASFGQGDRLSVFQVVQNPVWITPYLSTVLVVLGLALQFLMHLSGFVRKQKR